MTLVLRRQRMEEDTGVEEEESGRGRWHQGGGRSTVLALRRVTEDGAGVEEDDRVQLWRPRRRRTEEDAGVEEEDAGHTTLVVQCWLYDAGAQGGCRRRMLAPRRRTGYDTGAEEEDGGQRWRRG